MAVYTESLFHVQRIDIPNGAAGVDFDIYENTHTVIIGYWGTAAGPAAGAMAIRQRIENHSSPASLIWGSLRVAADGCQILQIDPASKTPGSRKWNLQYGIPGTAYVNVTQVVGVAT